MSNPDFDFDSFSDIESLQTESPEREAPLSSTALDLDKWSVRRGKELLESSEPLQGHIPEQPEAAADFFSAGFEPEPVLAETCSDKTRHDFLKQLFETPEYIGLHSQTVLDPLASEIAALALAKQYAGLKEEAQKEDQNSGTTQEGDSLQNEIKNIRAVGKALAESKKEVSNLRDTKAALGIGSNDGEKTTTDLKKTAELFKLVQNDPFLRRIINLAGRYRRMAQATQRQKVEHGRDDMVGIELAGDIGRLIPSELAKLSVPDLELDVLRRIVERQAQCRQYRTIEKVGKGPIILFADESGSMGKSDNIYHAKAIALTIAWIAKHQNRWCALVGFDHNTYEPLVLEPKKWDQTALLKWCTHFNSGGTKLGFLARDKMNNLLAQTGAPGKTDVILITDAITRTDDELTGSFNKWKKESNAKLTSILVSEGQGAEAIKAISDTFHVTSKLDNSDAINSVLSI